MKHEREPIIEVKNLTFSYDRETVLKDVELTVFRGEFLGLIGPNGSGKSTLIKSILGLEQPDQGEVQLFGHDLSTFREWHRIGYVSQKASSFNTNFPATVFEVVSTGLYGKIRLYKRMSDQDRRTVREMIERVGLSDFQKRKIGALSGGQQQRVFIARALVSQPDLLILDEPTVGVDLESVERLFRFLGELRREREITILLVSHDIEGLTSQVSRIACLNQRLHFHGDPHEFTANQEEILSQTYGRDLRLLQSSY